MIPGGIPEVVPVERVEAAAAVAPDADSDAPVTVMVDPGAPEAGPASWSDSKSMIERRYSRIAPSSLLRACARSRCAGRTA